MNDGDELGFLPIVMRTRWVQESDAERERVME
jgi:hypothetical protein